jgi:segregation and condensation protein B
LEEEIQEDEELQIPDAIITSLLDEEIEGELDKLGDIEEESVEIKEGDQEDIGEIEETVESDEEFSEGTISEEIVVQPEGEIAEISEEERAEILEKEFHKNQIEASLFVAGRPLGLEELSVKLDLKKDFIKNLIQDLAFEYLDRTTAIEIVQIGDKYSMQIKPEYTEKVSKFAAGGLIPERIMRTLTIIALKQPLLKSTVVKLRGSGAYEHVKWLLDNEFINAVKKGRTFELTTSNKFAETFGFSTNIEEMKKQMISQLQDDKPEEEE